MLIINPEDSFFSYSGSDNVLVLSITGFVRQDGGLVLIDTIAKEASTIYPSLTKRWGWMVSQGVTTPMFREGDVCFLGLPDRKHYASKLDPDLVESSLWYLQDIARDNHGIIYYLYPLCDNLELHKKILGDLPNIVLFREETT